MRISVEDPSVLVINTCLLSDNRVGVYFVADASETPYEIIFTREELIKMIEAININEIF